MTLVGHSGATSLEVLNSYAPEMNEMRTNHPFLVHHFAFEYYMSKQTETYTPFVPIQQTHHRQTEVLI